MAQNTNSNKKLRASYHIFKGIDAGESHQGEESICDLKNFMILPNGSIRRRMGYKTIFTADSNIRAVWSGTVDGYKSCYFIAKNQVYQLYEVMNYAGAFATIGTSSGKAEFFLLRNSLYIIDGKKIYRLKNYTFSETTGYVPLLGKDWPVGKVGEINEPLNILHSRARITYKAGSSPSAYLATLYPVESVQAVYKNGELVSASDYTIDTRLNTINLMGIQSGDSIEVNVTFTPRNTEERNTLLSCTSATVFGGINNSRLFMWNGSTQNIMFASRYVNDESLREAEKRYADCGDIYFPEGNAFIVGNGGSPIKAVTRHYDRLVILTTEDTWMADNSTCDIEPFPIMNINSNVGCPINHGAVTMGNDIISIGDKAIYQWTSKTNELDETNAYRISDPIFELFGDYFLQNAFIFAYKDKKQIWIASTASSSVGIVWIYDITRKIWFSYDNVKANMFFNINGNVGFIDGKNLRIFYEDLDRDYDTLEDTVGTEIIASIQSGILDFGVPRSKKLSSLVLTGDIFDSYNEIEFFCDSGAHTKVSLAPLNNDHTILKKRLFPSRFKSLYFKLTSKGNSRQTLHSLYIEAR